VITENIGSQPPHPVPLEAQRQGSGVPVQPGQQQISAAVQVIYTLE
jgi:uncharacterized protein YggE